MHFVPYPPLALVGFIVRESSVYYLNSVDSVVHEMRRISTVLPKLALRSYTNVLRIRSTCFLLLSWWICPLFLCLTNLSNRYRRPSASSTLLKLTLLPFTRRCPLQSRTSMAPASAP